MPTTPLPPLASFAELLRTAVRAGTATVTEGSRRNARGAIAARASDTASAELALSRLAPAAGSSAEGGRRSA